MNITNKKLTEAISEIDTLIQKYNGIQKNYSRDYSSYENNYEKRLRSAMKLFQEIISDAVKVVEFKKGCNLGRPKKLSLEKRVKIILIQRYMQNSNRKMSADMILFSFLEGIEISYKLIERLYDDDEVKIVLANVNSIFLRKMNLLDVDLAGDGTGFLLSIKEHYASQAQKLKEKGKTNSKKRKTLFCFSLMDVKTRLYIAYGTSYTSEKDAYKKAMLMIQKLNININSIRLDKYYSGQTLVKDLNEMYEGINCYLIPKKGATIRGTYDWKRMLDKFCNNTMEYLSEYFKRNQSESGFSEDKRRFGWRIPQKIESRVDLAYFSIFTWHNFMWVGQ